MLDEAQREWLARHVSTPVQTPPQRLARLAIGMPVAALAVLLIATAGRYGYHRDELYFRSLPPASGYVDQPPFVPWLVRAFASLSDELWVLRLPAVLLACTAIVVFALITAEVGGTARAQALAAWGAGFGIFPVVFGHVLLTATVDLVVWPLVGLFVIRAVRRDERWLLAAGVAIGLSTFNKLLIALLVIAVLAGIAIAGPRLLFRSKSLWLAAGIAAVLVIPAIMYQVNNGWPQLAMGDALARENAADARAMLLPFLALLLGPPLTVIWAVGIGWPWRAARARYLRFLAPALIVLLAECFYSPGQVYYPLGLITIAYAVGCVPVAEWMSTHARRIGVGLAVAVNALAAIAFGLPVIPESIVGETPIPGLNQAVADQIGWPDYVEQIATAYATLDPATSAIITDNYGEYGAIKVYGADLGLPRVYSGHNHLALLGPPPEQVTSALFVGNPSADVTAGFVACTTIDTLRNMVGVENEEVGQPLIACTGRTRPWVEVWPLVEHLG